LDRHYKPHANSDHSEISRRLADGAQRSRGAKKTVKTCSVKQNSAGNCRLRADEKVTILADYSKLLTAIKFIIRPMRFVSVVFEFLLPPS